MRKKKLASIVVPMAIAVWLGWYFASSYDFTPSTTENPFGVQATLEYVRDLKISCPISPCGPLNAFMLSYHSKEPVQIVSYNICGGVFCIKRDGLGYSLGGGRGTVGEIPWKIGDTVNIRVKVKPVEILENGKVTPKDEMYFIDLGKSKITETEDR